MSNHGGKRKGAGRPAELDEPRRMELKLDKSDWKDLVRFARRERISKSQVLRQALRMYVKE